MNTILGGEIKILLYILIGVVYLFSTLYKKAKRQQEERKVNKRPVSSKNADEIFKELQRSLNIPSSTALPEEGKKTERRQPMKKLAPVRKPAYMSIKPRVNKPVVKTTTFKQDSRALPKQVIEPVQPSVAETMDFDPRKAVIFSEILTRPQY